MNPILISNSILAVIIIGIPMVGLIRKVDIFESFIQGGKQGFDIIIKITPFIIGMYVAIGMLQASGFFNILLQYSKPVLDPIGFPAELLPLAILRPISGSGSLAMLANIVSQYGPDSIISLTASTILGSTETTFYVLAIYFGSVGVKKYRHALATGLIADAAGIIASIIICSWIF